MRGWNVLRQSGYIVLCRNCVLLESRLSDIAIVCGWTEDLFRLLAYDLSSVDLLITRTRSPTRKRLGAVGARTTTPAKSRPAI